MNTRKILFASIASFALLAASTSCTPNTSEDELYDNSIDKDKADIDPRRNN